LDRANHFGPLNYAETISATNPCGEQTLAPGGVCNLGSLNLTQFINKDRTGFNLSRIKKYTRYLVRFLDNISTLSDAPLLEYVDSMRKKRRIGCGILGWGSALFMLKVRFGSDESAKLRDDVMRTIAREAYMASIDLAEEKGMFELCQPEKHADGQFVKDLNLSSEYMEKLRTIGIRNSSLLSIQPTGNTSIQANVVSGGLEPIFMPEYIRTVIVNEMPEHIADVTPKWYEGEFHTTSMFKKAKEGDEEILRGVDEHGTVYKIDKNRGLTKEVLCEDYGVRWLKNEGEWDPEAEWAVTTENLSVHDHVSDLQGFARWVDSAMSKTINVPNNYPFDKFQDIYLDSYNTGYVKGVTTYRAGTMTTVLSAAEEKCADASDEEIIKEDVKLPDSAPAVMKTLRAEGKKYYVTVVYHEDAPDRPFALFVKTNSHEATPITHEAVESLLKLARRKKIPKRHVDDVIEKISKDNNVHKIARVISFLLRHGVMIKNIVAVMDKCESAYIGTFVYQIRKFLSSFIKDGEEVEDESCKECGGVITYSEGCFKCTNCGVSRC
jgi:ribonucleoside-diphosphate reductase alpha chain